MFIVNLHTEEEFSCSVDEVESTDFEFIRANFTFDGNRKRESAGFINLLRKKTRELFTA
jgi:hypothetical protein